MRNQRERNRRTFGLESLEGRLAPSGGLSHGMHDRGAPHVEIQDNHRGRDLAPHAARVGVVDNDLNDLPGHDANDLLEHNGGVDPNHGPNHDAGADHSGRGRGHR